MRSSFRRILNLAGNSLALLGIIFLVLLLREYGKSLDLSRIGLRCWATLAVLTLIYALVSGMLALSWWYVLHHLGTISTRRMALKIYGFSQLAKYVPGNIFHFAGRQAMGMAAGMPGRSLAKSTAWEVGLISASGCIFSILVLSVFFPLFEASTSFQLFWGFSISSVLILWYFVDRLIAKAFVLYFLFHFMSGVIFIIVLIQVVPYADSLNKNWIFLGGSYVASWTIGLLTPGAPAGGGVRELVLLYAMKHEFSDANILLAVMLGRLITVGGDIIFFFVSKILR